MRQFLLLILCFSLIGISGIFAAETNPLVSAGNGEPQNFETYQRLLKIECDATDKVWNDPKTGGPIVSAINYAELIPSVINNNIAQTIAAENLPSEKEKLAREINLIQSGEFEGFKSVELARIRYRSAMNNIFACAVIDARIQVVSDLQKKIEKSFPGKKTEIINKLTRETKKLQEVRGRIPCNTKESDSNNIPVETRITNSVTQQYCHYTFYLSYLKDNLAKDNLRVMEIEKKIGNGTNMPTTTSQWLQEYTLRNSQVDKELNRSTSTLTLALRTFQEMKRTYAVHIMLTIVYDDYLRLRENLNRYFNITSQFFEKMYNAQDSQCYK